MKYSKELLEPIVLKSNSYGDVCRLLNISTSTGAQSYVTNKIKEFGLDVAHFTGQNWRKGRNFPNERVDLSKLLVKGRKVGSHSLKKYLIIAGIKQAQCEICFIKDWQREPVVLELDHIDSDHDNNELINLQIICPNCHAQVTRQRIQAKKIIKPVIVKKTKKQSNPNWRHLPKLTQRKVERPSLEVLIKETSAIGYVATGKKYGVSDNCIRKWIKFYKSECDGMVDNTVLETVAK